jgi:hypothetical protein
VKENGKLVKLYTNRLEDNIKTNLNGKNCEDGATSEQDTTEGLCENDDETSDSIKARDVLIGWI